MPSWVTYAFLSALAASLVAIFGKLGLKGVDPVAGTFVRAVIMTGVCALAVVLFIKGEQVRTLLGGTGVGWIIASAVAGALSWLWCWRFWCLVSKFVGSTGSELCLLRRGHFS